MPNLQVSLRSTASTLMTASPDCDVARDAGPLAITLQRQPSPAPDYLRTHVRGSRWPRAVLAFALGLSVANDCAPAMAQGVKGPVESHMTISDADSSHVEAVRFSPDGAFLASAGFDGSVKLWDVASRRMRLTLSGTSQRITSIAYSSSGKMLAATSTEKLGSDRYAGVALLWELPAGRLAARLVGEQFTNPAEGVGFSPDDKTLAVGSARNFLTQKTNVSLWDIATQKIKRTCEVPMNGVNSLAWLPDGGSIVVAGWDKDGDEKAGAIARWTLATSQVKPCVKGAVFPIFCVAVSPDGNVLAAGGGNIYEELTQLGFWDVKTGEQIAALQGHEGPVHAVAFSPNGRILASAGGDQYRKRGELRLWDVRTRKVLAFLTGHKDLVTSVAFSPDGKLLASGSNDKSIILWDISGWTSAPKRK